MPKSRESRKTKPLCSRLWIKRFIQAKFINTIKRMRRFFPYLYSPKLRPLMMAGGPLVFVHVPKTGGTTFVNEVLLPLFHYDEVYRVSPKRVSGDEIETWARFSYEVFSPLFPSKEDTWKPSPTGRMGPWEDLESFSDEYRRSLRLVVGHMPFGAFEGLLERPRYMTFLRDPVERAVSDYYYCRQRSDNPAHEPSMKFDILEFCRLGYGQMQNCHTRYLSNNVFGEVYESDDAMLAAAKASIDRCCFFGLTERFEDSLRILNRKIGYDAAVEAVPVWNPSKRPDRVSEEVREALAGYNALDMELYAYAAERFEAQATS